MSHFETRHPSVFPEHADDFAHRHGDTIVLIGRVLVGWIFVTSGWAKLMDIPAFAAGLARNGVPAADMMAYVGATVEFVGGVALVVGLAMRYAAVLMIVFTIVATLISHRYWEFAEPAARRAQSSNFYKNLAIIGGLMFLLVSGGGRLAIDRLFHSRR